VATHYKAAEAAQTETITPTSLGFSGGTLTLGRNGLSSITTTINTTHVTEGTNLYHTTARARASLSQGYGITYNTSTGVIDADTATLFNSFNSLSWDNSSLYDSSFWYKSLAREARGKSIIKDWTNNGRGLVDVRAVTDSTISHKLTPKVMGVKSLTEIRALTDFAATDTQYVVKLTDYTRKFTQEYQYDPGDASSADDGGLTIVAGTKRFKAVISQFIDARIFGVSASLSNNATALQAAVTAASTYSGTKTVMLTNGSYALTSNVTIPAGVTLFVAPGALITGTATISGGIIKGGFRQQLFSTTITVHPDAVADGYFSMKWYGALGDGSDDVLKLQKCFDVCTYQNKIKRIWWPNGSYTISKGLLFDRDDNADGTRDNPTGYIIEGENKAYGGTGEVTVTCNNGNSFGINFQQVKGLVVRNIVMIGQNEELAALSISDIMQNPSTNWDNGNRTNDKSPHVGFGVDCIGLSSTIAGTNTLTLRLNILRCLQAAQRTSRLSIVLRGIGLLVLEITSTEVFKTAIKSPITIAGAIIINTLLRMAAHKTGVTKLRSVEFGGIPTSRLTQGHSVIILATRRK
jgi:hypothetical protein